MEFCQGYEGEKRQKAQIFYKSQNQNSAPAAFPLRGFAAFAPRAVQILTVARAFPRLVCAFLCLVRDSLFLTG